MDPTASSAENSDLTVLGRALPTITDQAMKERLATVTSYTAVLLRTTSSFVRPDVDPIIWEHGRRNFALMHSGIATLVLPAVDDSDWAGLYVFTVPPDDVHAVMHDDPGVAAGIFTYEVHPVLGFPGSALPA